MPQTLLIVVLGVVLPGGLFYVYRRWGRVAWAMVIEAALVALAVFYLGFKGIFSFKNKRNAMKSKAF